MAICLANNTNSRLLLFISYLFGLKCGMMLILVFRMNVEINSTERKKILYNKTYLEVENGDRNVSSLTRIVCWIATYPANHYSKAIHVRKTWGKRCDKLIFMSSEADEKLPSVNLQIPETRKNLWMKTRAGFKHVFEHHL